MGQKEICEIGYLVTASAVLIVLPILVGLIRYFWYKRFPERRRRGGVSGVLVFSVFLIASIWLMRMAVGKFLGVYPNEETLNLPEGEGIMNSLFAALRTFSLEEEYGPYILEIGRMHETLSALKADAFWMPKGVFVAYATALNLAAPVAGGAILLEILASVFPKIKLGFANLLIWKEKCYFNELNPATLELAKSLIYHYTKEQKKPRPVLIFTDTYVDDENEKEYELLLEAKRIGAITVRDDLAHVSKPRLGKKNYYLMDENEYSNLQTMMGLTEVRNVRYIKKSMIYLFVRSDVYVQIEKQVFERLKHADGRRRAVKPKDLPLIIPVNAFRNLAQNLLVDVPLYEPLIGRKDNTELNVTILGNGIIGTETFLAVYWFGQMLHTVGLKQNEKTVLYKVCVNIVSKDTEEEFWSKIDYINPEIRQTVEIVHDDGTVTKMHNDPYCAVHYLKADVKNGGLWNAGDRRGKELLQSDYYIVALGTDADNISIADSLRELIGEYRLEHNIDRHTVIAYAVFDSTMCETLNRRIEGKKKSDVYLHAFGSLAETYSHQNLFMTKMQVWANDTGDAYQRIQKNAQHVEAHRTRSKNDNKNYQHWADIARAMHVKYKIFSLGWMTDSLFDSDKTHAENVQKLCAQYRRIAILNTNLKLTADDEKKRKDLEKKKHALAWLEHRRWCAFTRTLGYRHTDALEKNLEAEGHHKNMSLKLHPCLVEARRPDEGKPYIFAPFDETGKVLKTEALCGEFLDARLTGKLDALDRVSIDWKELLQRKDPKKAEEAYDFKMYDYYRYEFDDCVLFSEFNDWNRSANDKLRVCYLDSKTLKRCCVKGEKHHIEEYKPEKDENWIIPVSYLEARLRRKYVTETEENFEKTGIQPDFVFADQRYCTKKRQKEMSELLKEIEAKEQAEKAKADAEAAKQNEVRKDA